MGKGTKLFVVQPVCCSVSSVCLILQGSGSLMAILMLKVADPCPRGSCCMDLGCLQAWRVSCKLAFSWFQASTMDLCMSCRLLGQIYPDYILLLDALVSHLERTQYQT